MLRRPWDGGGDFHKGTCEESGRAEQVRVLVSHPKFNQISPTSTCSCPIRFIWGKGPSWNKCETHFILLVWKLRLRKGLMQPITGEVSGRTKLTPQDQVSGWLSGLHYHTESSCFLCAGSSFLRICSQLFPRPSVVNQLTLNSQKPLCEANFR